MSFFSWKWIIFAGRLRDMILWLLSQAQTVQSD